jgi:hypothetical protein
MGGNVPQSKISNGKLFEAHVLLSTGTELELWTAVGSKLHMVEGRNRVTVWNWFYAVFITLIKNMTQVVKCFRLSL